MGMSAHKLIGESDASEKKLDCSLWPSQIEILVRLP